MRRILCAILAFIILSFSIISFVYAEEMTDLQTQQEELKNQIKDKTGELDGVKEEISENLQKIQELDEKIANSQTEIEEVNKKISELQTSIKEVEEKLKMAEERFNKQEDKFKKRIVAMYEASDTQYLDVVLKSKNISDFLSSYFLITELANYDVEILDDMENKKNEIKTTSEKLQKQQKEYATMKRSQTQVATILENTKTVRENYIAKLSDQERELQTQIDEYNARYAQINAEILEIALSGIDTKYIGGELAWPVPGYTRISSSYGMRYHPILHINKLHTGVDISAPMGANFIAANDGIVTKAELNSAYGNMVIIDHGGGVSTLYAHGSEILVHVGQVVKRGESILKVGSTGYSTGPHAHFEVRLNGVVTDPLPYITTGMIPKTQEKDDSVEKETNETNTENNTNNQNVVNEK